MRGGRRLAYGAFACAVGTATFGAAVGVSVGACGSAYGEGAESPGAPLHAAASDAEVSDGATFGETDGPTLAIPDCTAQRTVHIVAGTGGLAWFTLALPMPKVINEFQGTFAYDDPAFAVTVPNDTAGLHPVIVRKVDGRPMWATGLPTRLIAGERFVHAA